MNNLRFLLAYGFEIRVDLIARHITVGIVAVVGMTRKPDAPIGGDQTEAVPTSAPGLADAALFEDDVFDAALAELATDREAGLSSADNDEIQRFRRRLS